MELQTYLRIIRVGWVWLILGTLLGIGAAAGWVALQKPVYTADASGFVAVTGQGEDTGSALIADNLAKSKVKSYIDLGTWRSVAEDVITQLGLDTRPETLVDQVRVSNPVDTVNLLVVANASTPEGARDLAQAWIQAMSSEISQLESRDGGQALVQLVAGDSAQLPRSPSSPNWRIALAVGGLIGLAAGVSGAVVRYVLDRRIRSAEVVERETGHPVVGTIPLEKSFTDTGRLVPFDGGMSGGARAKFFRVAESLRELRTNLQFIDVDNPPRVIVISSPLPGDGKSTTSANLAIVLAASGQRVVLIDGDLRRPMVANIFGLIDGAGLTDVLAGRALFDEVAQPVGVDGNLLVLGAGMLPPNPSEVLGSERMRDLMRTLSADATIIIDAPPLLPVTDAAVLGHHADGVMVVASVGKTTIETLNKAMLNLEKANARCLGVVINRVPVRGRGRGYDDYQYTGDYYAAPPSATPEPVTVAGPSSASVKEARGSSRKTEGGGVRRSTAIAVPTTGEGPSPSRRSRRTAR